MEPAALLSADEVRRLITRCVEAIDQVDFRALSRNRSSNDRDLLDVAREGLRFALTGARALRDPTLLPAVLEALGSIECWRVSFGEHIDEVLFPSLQDLLSRLEGVHPEIEFLIEHDWVLVRAAVAQGLRPRNRWARGLLEALAHDVWKCVRLPAQEQLRKSQDVPWWWGIFESDPAPRLSPEQAQTHSERFKHIAEGFDPHRAEFGELLKELDALPEPLGAEVAWRLYRSEGIHHERYPKLFSLMLRQPDDVRALEMLLIDASHRDWWYKHADGLGQALLNLPPARATRLRHQVIVWLRSKSIPSGATDGYRRMLAHVVVASWPKDLDPTLLVDLALEPPLDSKDRFVHVLGRVLEKVEVLPELLLERIVAAQQQGFPGNWDDLRSSAEKHIERIATPRLRQLAERSLQSTNDEVVIWALKQLLHRLHQPERDGSRAETVERFWKDSRFRDLLIREHPELVVPLLRRELRLGLLNLPEACKAMGQIKHFYGGVAPMPTRQPRTEAQRESERRKRRRVVRDMLGPRLLRGPPTEKEWEAFRAVRDRDFVEESKKNSDHLYPELAIVPPGPEWHPADRAFFWRAVKLWFETHNEELNLQLLRLIATKPLPEDALVLERLYRGDRLGWHQGKEFYAIALESLGLDEERADAG